MGPDIRPSINLGSLVVAVDGGMDILHLQQSLGSLAIHSGPASGLREPGRECLDHSRETGDVVVGHLAEVANKDADLCIPQGPAEHVEPDNIAEEPGSLPQDEGG